jgi:pyridoxal phosphate enzyme (YggS family)
MPDAQRILEQIPQHVTLLAVSKGQGVQTIEMALQQGIHQFGENYLQEAIAKIEALTHQPCTWHYIGHIQTNKCKKIAQYFDWVQTIDRIETAKKLNQACEAQNKILQVCIQINLHDEMQKAGISPIDAPSLITELKNLKHLNLRGLMLIPPMDLNPHELTQAYDQMGQLLKSWNQTFHLHMDTLSMGMSSDFQQAIAHGSTMVRIGQALFGERTKK